MRPHPLNGLAYLDLLPDTLYEPVINHRHGTLQQRCIGVLQWHAALMDGQLPDKDSIDWPLPAPRHHLLKQLRHAGLAKHCRDQAQRSAQVLLDILRWLDDNPVDFSAPGDDITDDHPHTPYKPPPPQARADDDQESVAGSGQQPTTGVQNNHNVSWQQQSERLDDIDTLLQHYHAQRRLGWDLSTGLLHRDAWRDILKLHGKLKHAQYLKYILSLIGRRQLHGATRDTDRQQLQQHSADHRERQDVRSIHAPMETSGITLSDDIGRMLASELAALGHPQLKILWHARRAERMLLSYQFDGVLSEHTPAYDLQASDLSDDRRQHTKHRGPMILCLDTSASMKGQPEALAKAIVLEAFRVALREQRECRLLSFSGPGEIHQHLLDPSELGWHHLLDIISLSFHGGTDLRRVIAETISVIHDKAWREADMLLISDSRFNTDDALQAQLLQCRQSYGLRCFGINVSRWNSRAMEILCDSVFRITDFGRHSN